MTKLSLLDRLEQFFREHEGQWIDGRRLHIAGSYAWRTRVSDLRLQRRMTIENRVRRVAKPFVTPEEFVTVSEYRFVPAPEPRQASLLESDHERI